MSAEIVIAGGGLAAQRCAETLRRAGHDGPIRMICAEPHRPYDRPPLSKALLGPEGAGHDTSFRTAGWYEEQRIELLLGVAATALDPATRSVALGDGTPVRYDRLLIATGSRPRTLALLEGFANVSTLRTIDDAHALRESLAPGARIVVAGAGFIGQEVAAAAVKAGARTTIVEAARAPMEALLGATMGQWFADLHRRNGVQVVTGAQITQVQGDERVASVTLSNGRRLRCDHVVVGVGVVPDVAWVGGSGLDPSGIRVAPGGRTALPGVFAAGDAAAAYEPLLGRHVPGAHWEAAARQGAAAARAMLGLDVPAAGAASFWSDLYGTRVQYLGHARLADGFAIEGDTTAPEFTATFTRAGAPVAVLLVGRPHDLPRARALLST
jgi:3-phenylpropionate/trans-cinnamate dioxygenase ferredoxin reductase subunit